MTDPLPAIIDRETPARDVNTHFSKAVWLLQDLVNYGSCLIPRCFESSSKTTADVVVLAALTKQALSHLDGIEVLISRGAILGSHVSARAFFEACLYVAWILDSDTDRRARQYYVWNLRQTRLWALRFTPGSPEHVALKESLKSSPSLPDLTSFADLPATAAEAQNQLANIDRLLSMAVYKPINEEFDRLKGAKGKYDKPWYAPFSGPASIRRVALALDRVGEYEVFYSMLSDVTHSSAVRKSFGFRDNRITFEPIRQLDSIDVIMRLVIRNALELYRAVLNKYRPGELDNISRKWTLEWAEAFNSIRAVTYKVEPYSSP